MPILCGYSWGSDVDAAIKDRASAFGLPLDLAFTYPAAESGFNPYITGDTIVSGSGTPVVGPDGHAGRKDPQLLVGGKVYQVYGVAWEDYYHPGQFGCSHGLLQLNSCGGQGQGMSWSELTNPWINCNVGLKYIADAFRAVWSPTIPQYDFIYQISTQSGHPGPVDYNDYRITTIFGIWQCFYQALVLNPPPAPAPAPAPTPPPNNPPPVPSPLPPPDPPPPVYIPPPITPVPFIPSQNPDTTFLFLLAGGALGLVAWSLLTPRYKKVVIGNKNTFSKIIGRNDKAL